MAAPVQPYASASLYVGDLATDVTEALLFEIFKAIGPVASIRVCRDSLTRRSLGYAYVNFHNVADAERAIEQLNYSRILDKPCRIMWSHRDPSKRRSGVGNVFIKNLDKSIDNTALYDTFASFGHILSCKVEMDQHGVSKGYGYVHYETQEAAEQAIARVNGMRLFDKIVFVGMFQAKRERNTDDVKQKYTNVFVKNIDGAYSSDLLNAKFSEFGKVTSAVVMPDDKGESKGFGFVNFEKSEDAQKAVEALNGSVINGKTIYVGRAQKKGEREEELKAARMGQMQKYQGVNVYVKNLDDSIDDDRLRQEFAKFGTITSSKVMRDDKINSKGFGFVCYSNPEEATRAVTEMNGTLLVSKPLYVGLAQRKDFRRSQLEALHNQKLSQMRMQPGVLPPMYPNGQPVFFQPGMPPRMYPQQMVPRQRYNAAPPAGPNSGAAGAAAGGGAGGPAAGGAGGAPRQGGYQQPGGYPVPMGGAGNVRQPPRGGGARNPRQPAQGGPMQGQPQGRPVAPPNTQTRGFKLNATARNHGGSNMPSQQFGGAAPATGAAPASGASAGGVGLQTTPEQLEAQMGGEESKQMIGEQLYASIAKTQPHNAGKITGMLLESLELRELFVLLQNNQQLETKISEALTVLKEQGNPDEGASA